LQRSEFPSVSCALHREMNSANERAEGSALPCAIVRRTSVIGSFSERTPVMADQPRRPRTLNDARTEAEAAFKRTTTKVAEAPPRKAVVPGVKELISLRIDQDVLEFFQEGGPGWQDRINEALRKLAGK
jgi:uncharacterized protein (DUF4415 family)